MDGPMKQKSKITSEDEEQEDRISRLPDDLIHQILKFVDTKLGVQTSAISKRWKLVWTTLPFLKFRWDQSRYDGSSCSSKSTTNLARHVLKHRNHQAQISYLELAFLPSGLFAKFVSYAIAHSVQHLNVHFREKHKPYKLSNFNCDCIEKLEMRMELDDSLRESDCWDLPALASLRLRGYLVSGRLDKLPEMCVTCLPALRSLNLEEWNLERFSFSLPNLTNFRLWCCRLPQTIWDFPVLKSLELCSVEFPENMSDIFAALVSLQNLTIYFYGSHALSAKDCFINCPQLINLQIITSYSDRGKANIVVAAPKIRNFTSVGIFTITFGASKLDTVNIKLKDWINSGSYKWLHQKELKQDYQRFKFMLPGLATAKILKLDLETIEALSLISDFLGSSSPFYNLKYVKLPHGCKESSISTSLRKYLLGASPTATIVTTFPQNHVIPYTATTSLTTQYVVREEPLAAVTRVLTDVERTYKKMRNETMDMGVQEKHVLHADKVRNSVYLIEGIGNDRLTSSRGGSNLGLWRGHEVNSEFVCLLNRIMNKYPETFESFAIKNKKFCTVMLNMLCTSVNDFIKFTMTEVDRKMIAEYRDVFADLKILGFDVSWLAGRLNYIEHLQFSHPLLTELYALDGHLNGARSKLQYLQTHSGDTEIRLQDLQTLRDEKMQEIEKAFGTLGTKLVAGCIGDELLSTP
ncbi:putative FBD-associated F-box protein At5g53640 [Daucus carota subsp. sativus]